VFTVASFWWLNARQGVLRSWEPHSFAAAVTPQLARLRFPLVLYKAVDGVTASDQSHEFGAPFPGFVPEARDYRAVIEVRLGHDRTKDDLRKADAALGALLAKLQESSASDNSETTS